jgi:hypothetical protein
MPGSAETDQPLVHAHHNDKQAACLTPMAMTPVDLFQANVAGVQYLCSRRCVSEALDRWMDGLTALEIIEPLEPQVLDIAAGAIDPSLGHSANALGLWSGQHDGCAIGRSLPAPPSPAAGTNRARACHCAESSHVRYLHSAGG